MDTLPANLEIALDETQFTLVLVQQYDAQLDLHCGIEVLAVPGPRYQTVACLLPPGNGKMPIRLVPRFKDQTWKQFSYQTVLVDPGSGEARLARHLHDFSVFWRKGDEESLRLAIRELEVALSNSGDSDSLVDLARFNLGLAYYQQFNFVAAKRAYESLSDAWWQNPARALTTHWALAAIALEQAELAEARLRLEKSLQQFPLVQDSTLILCDRLESELYLGLVLMRLDEVEAGIALLRAAMHCAEEIRSNTLRGKLNINIGGFYEFYDKSEKPTLERYESALQHYRNAFELLDEVGIVADTMTAQLNLGRLKIQAGELDGALAYFQAALQRNHAQHNKVIRSYLYLNMGIVYELLGDNHRAKHYLQRSYDLRGRAGGKRFQTKAALSLGRLERNTNNVEQALWHHQRCLDFYQNINAMNDMIEAEYELAEDYLAAGQAESALSLLEQAEDHLQDVDLPLLSMQVPRAKVAALAALNQTPAARAEIRRLLPIARQSKVIPELISTLHLAARITRDDVDQALQLTEEAATLVESVRGRFESSRLGTSFNARVHAIFAFRAELLLQQSTAPEHVAAAINSLERGRASEFYSAHDDAGDDEVAEVKKRLSLLSEARISQLGKPVAEIDDAYFEALDELGALTPAAATKNFMIDLDQFHREGHGLLYYLVFAEQAYCVVITGTSKKCFELNAGELEMSAALQTNDLSLASLAGMSRLVVPERVLAEIASCNRVTIVPHGPLHGVPFAALLDENGELLFADKTVELAYSLGSLATVQRDERTPSAVLELAIFADPDFTGEVSSGLRGWTKDLERLPWTAEEAKAIVQTFSEANCVSFVGSQATRENLLQNEVKAARVLHIASHGFYDKQLSEIVGIALSSNEQEAGFIGLTDLQHEGFNNDLVVISGCETGQGELLSGEGTVSVARAFLAQGVSYVVSTLWPVADRTSAIFMRLFYETLALHGDPGRALRAAQLKLQAQVRYRDPSHWGAYQLHTRRWYQRSIFDE
jgi:CHAT domain-containing protein/tetratricopeptide (TPR) repeat protein